MEHEKFHHTVKTEKSYQQVISDLDASLKEDKFGVQWSFAVHEKLAEKGYPINKEITILEVCNPKEAAHVLELDPIISYFLPCKIVVTNDESGVSVGMVRPSFMLTVMDNPDLTEFAQQVENQLIAIIERAV